MIKINTNKFPIIILSSPRTGSSVLGDYISTNNKIPFFCEPDEQGNMNDLMSYHDDNYVLKFHARAIKKYSDKIIKKIFANECFLIRIQRKNLVEQIASNYLALARGVWRYNSDTVYTNPESIDENLIYLSIATIHSYNIALKNLKLKYEEDLYYEDIIDSIKLENHICTPKPFFYDELKDKIKKKL